MGVMRVFQLPSVAKYCCVAKAQPATSGSTDTDEKSPNLHFLLGRTAGNDASGNVDRARAGDLYQRLKGIPFGEHVCGRRPGRGIGKRPVEKHLLRSTWSEPHRDRRIEIVAAAAVEREGRLHGVFAGIYPPVSHGGKAIIVSVMGEPNEGAVEVGEAGDVAVGGIDCVACWCRAD